MALHPDLTGAVVAAPDRHGLDVPLDRTALLRLLRPAPDAARPGVGGPGPDRPVAAAVSVGDDRAVDAATGPPDRFRLLYVCTGNICRSPFAQFHTRFLLEARLGPVQAGRFQVASAGTGAVVGHGMHELTRRQLTTRQDHPAVGAFRSRQLPDRDVLLADLVLVAGREHRSRVLQDVPQALGRTFTLREFARLLAAADRTALRALPADPVERARGLVAVALATRGTPPPVAAEADAVPDPIGGESEDHAEAARVIDEAVRAVLDVLVPAREPGRPVPPPPGPPVVPPGTPAPRHHRT